MTIGVLLQAQLTSVIMSEGQVSLSVAPNLAIVTNTLVKGASVTLSQIQHVADENITVGPLPSPLTASYVSEDDWCM